jgi:hypothetical protein
MNVKSKGVVTDNFIWGGENINLLEGFKASCGRSSTKKTNEDEDVRMVTVAA